MGAENTLDLTALNGLSDAEREYALRILADLANGDGTSKLYDELKYEEYTEVPVDIETFLTDDRYLGQAWKDATGKLKLYDFWLEQLKKLFPTNIDTAYNTLLESGARGIGKAQPLDSLVFTEFGYRQMGDIKLGDRVYGNDGKLHNVIGVFPQGVKPVCKLTFSDKTTTFCSDEHLWTVYDNAHNVTRKTPKTVTCRELYETGIKLKSGEPRYKIPITQPLQFEHKDTLISPYVMGVLLGDGVFGEHTVGFTTYDKEIYDEVNTEAAKQGCILMPSSHCVDNSSWYFKNNKHIVGAKTLNIFTNYGRDLGLAGKHAWDKFIPDIYLYNDVNSRYALLQGLMDTGGEDGPDYQEAYSTTSEVLAKQIVFLVQSLGGTALLKEHKNNTYVYKGERRACRDSYTVNIKMPRELPACRLNRKCSRINPNRLQPFRYIKCIEYVEPQECQCILLDSKEHLYLTNDLIVTHNSEIACGCVATYLMYRVMCLKNPLEHFHLKQTEKICFAFMNIKLALAEDIAISKFQKTLQMSPWFMSRGKLSTYKNKPYWTPPEPIQIIIGSQSDDVIGLPIFFAFFDEISFIKNQDIDKQKAKARDMISTAIGGMMTRFVHKGKNPTMLAVASSKRSEQSFMEEYIKTLSKTEGHSTLVVDKPVWEVKPKGTYSDEIFYVGLGNKFLESVVIPDEEVGNLDLYKQRGYQILEVPIDFKSKFLEDIDRNLCDFAGISSSSTNKYMSARAVSETIKADLQNPLPDVLEIGNGKEDTAQYYNFFDMSKIPQEFMYKPLYIHLDMSISGDMTGIAGVWITGKKVSTDDSQQSRDLQFQLAFSTSVKAPKGFQVSFEKNRNFVRWLKEQGFNVKGITSDTFQSYDLQQQLSAEGFDCSILSVDRVTDGICQPYQYLRSAVYEKRFIMYKSNRLFDEFVDIERNINTGKVDHSPNYHKDALDAVCGAIFNASKHAAEYAFDYGESLELTTQVNQAYGIDKAVQQLTLDFEAEMQRMLDSTQHTQQSKSDNNINKQHNDSATQQLQTLSYLANGIIVW